jgi:hypothetical protein
MASHLLRGVLWSILNENHLDVCSYLSHILRGIEAYSGSECESEGVVKARLLQQVHVFSTTLKAHRLLACSFTYHSHLRLPS